MKNQIYPCLWFDGQAKAAAEFYCSVFEKAKIIDENPLVVRWEINGQRFMGLNGGPMFKFSAANSYVIECDTQEEIDHFWEQLGRGGVHSQCGWLDDQFGVSWQVIPRILSELMADPERGKRVMDAFLKMTKFDIETLLNA